MAEVYPHEMETSMKVSRTECLRVCWVVRRVGRTTRQTCRRYKVGKTKKRTHFGNGLYMFTPPMKMVIWRTVYGIVLRTWIGIWIDPAVSMSRPERRSPKAAFGTQRNHEAVKNQAMPDRLLYGILNKIKRWNAYLTYMFIINWFLYCSTTDVVLNGSSFTVVGSDLISCCFTSCSCRWCVLFHPKQREMVIPID